MKKLLLSPTMLRLYLFLFLAAAVIGLWKILNLEGLLYDHFPGLLNALMDVEYRTTVFIMKIFVRNITIDPQQMVIRFPNNEGIMLLMGCSGLKQMLQFAIIMLVFPGPWKHKAWFIPASALILFLSAIFHFLLLSFILSLTPDSFRFFHEDLSRWIFFGVFFFLWVYWEEKILQRKGKSNDASAVPEVGKGK